MFYRLFTFNLVIVDFPPNYLLAEKYLFLPQKALPFYKIFTIGMILVMFSSHFSVVTQNNIFAPEISMFFQKLLSHI
jgi:hypothetical protein